MVRTRRKETNKFVEERMELNRVLRSKNIEMKRSEIEMTGFRSVVFLNNCVKF